MNKKYDWTDISDNFIDDILGVVVNFDRLLMYRKLFSEQELIDLSIKYKNEIDNVLNIYQKLFNFKISEKNERFGNGIIVFILFKKLIIDYKNKDISFIIKDFDVVVLKIIVESLVPSRERISIRHFHDIRLVNFFIVVFCDNEKIKIRQIPKIIRQSESMMPCQGYSFTRETIAADFHTLPIGDVIEIKKNDPLIKNFKVVENGLSNKFISTTFAY